MLDAKGVDIFVRSHHPLHRHATRRHVRHLKGGGENVVVVVVLSNILDNDSKTKAARRTNGGKKEMKKKEKKLRQTQTKIENKFEKKVNLVQTHLDMECSVVGGGHGGE